MQRPKVTAQRTNARTPTIALAIAAYSAACMMHVGSDQRTTERGNFKFRTCPAFWPFHLLLRCSKPNKGARRISRLYLLVLPDNCPGA